MSAVALVLDVMRRDRRRIAIDLRKAEAMPENTERRRHERDVLIGRRTRELEAHDRLIASTEARA